MMEKAKTQQLIQNHDRDFENTTALTRKGNDRSSLSMTCSLLMAYNKQLHSERLLKMKNLEDVYNKRKYE